MSEPSPDVWARARRPPLGATAVPEANGGHDDRPGGPLFGGRYRVGDRLGSGRLGEIYEAVDEASGSGGGARHVALQILHGNLAAERRFVEEIKRGCAALRDAAHPNIVRLLDFGRDGRDFYLVMERLEGASLRFALQSGDGEGLPLQEAAAVIRAVGDALLHLHAKGMVHGDLRPKNVFVTADYAVKLLDVAPLQVGRAGPYYVEDADPVAPKRRDPRDDVLGLASLAFELIAGHHPFNCNSPLEAHRAGLWPAPPANLPANQWEALASGLALERAKRTPTVTDFLRAFGITGAERLSAAAQASAPAEEANRSVPAAPAYDPQPIDDPDVWRDAPAAARAPEPPELEPDYERPYRERAASRPGLRRPLALVAVAALGALVYVEHDRLRENTSLWIESLAERLPSLAARLPFPPAGERARPVAPLAASQSAASRPQDTAPQNAAAEAAAVEAAAQEPAHGDAAVSDAAPAEVQPLEPQPASYADETPAPMGRSAEHIADFAPAEPAVTRIDFAERLVTVVENQGLARVVVQRSGDRREPATFSWWIVGDTATPGEDYANLQRRTERLGADAAELTLLIPLVDDVLPEPRESFYVYLAAPASGEPVRMRVDIEDDD